MPVSALDIYHADRRWRQLCFLAPSTELSGPPATEAEIEAALIRAAILGRRRYTPIVLDATFMAFLHAPCEEFENRLQRTVIKTLRPLMGDAGVVAEGSSERAWYYDVAVGRLGLWPLLSSDEQQRIDGVAAAAPVPPTGAPPATGVNLIGFASAVMGLGEDLRTTAQTLRALGIPLAIVRLPLPKEVGSSLAATPWDRYVVERPIFRINIFCVPWFETIRLYAEHGAILFAERYNIGLWPWELPTLPAAAIELCDCVDEIWAPSRFVAETYASVLSQPVELIPHVVEPGAVAEGAVSEVALPPDAFVVLSAFDLNSYVARKNPEASIRAFQAAFPDRGGRERLVMKSLNGHRHTGDRAAIEVLAAGDPRITVLDEAMSRPAFNRLVARADCLLSLHRAEGFGRIIAEAMVLGTPVVATDWSGSADFVTNETAFPVAYRLVPVPAGAYVFAEGAQWAEPDITAAAHALHAVRRGGEGVQKKVVAARRLMAVRHSREAVSAMMGRRLAALAKPATNP